MYESFGAIRLFSRVHYSATSRARKNIVAIRLFSRVLYSAASRARKTIGAIRLFSRVLYSAASRARNKIGVIMLFPSPQEVTIIHDIRCTKGLDIRLISFLDSVKTWLLSAIFQVFFTLWPLSTDTSLIFRYIQQTFCNILMKSVRYLIEIWSVFSWYPFIIPLISAWYPCNPEVRCKDIQKGVTPWIRSTTN